MRQRRSAATAVLLSVVLAGCGTWSHPTKPPSAFARDNAACELAAIKEVQVNAQQQTAPKWMAKSIGKTYTTDANETLRSRWHNGCLRILGWSFGSTPSQPTAAATKLAGSGRGRR
jgi:hypothetical protein